MRQEETKQGQGQEEKCEERESKKRPISRVKKGGCKIKVGFLSSFRH